ncbi:MAG: tetratricopeptide repeat protein [Kiritimatiellia bacterium]
MNKNKLIIGGILFAFALDLAVAVDPAKIDFHWNYKQRAAQMLFEKKDYTGAQKAAEDLVATAPDEQSKIKCLAISAVAMAHQGQYEQAIKKAQEIADKPVADYTRMEIMTVGNKQPDLIAAFKDTDLAAWPTNIAYKGYLIRGEAYKVAQDDKAALADMEQAAARSGQDTAVQLETLNKIGTLYEKLQDQAKALDAYRQVMEISATPRVKGAQRAYPAAILAAARILKDQKKYDEAIACLSRYEPSSTTSGLSVLDMSGDIYAAMGRKDEALAKYREIVKLATDTKNKRFAERANKKMEELK